MGRASSRSKRTSAATPAAALRAVWVAARLHGVSTSSMPAFTARFIGRELTYQEVYKAARPLMGRSGWRGARGRPASGALPAAGAQDDEAAMEEWLLVDERRLGLEQVLFRLPNDGLPRPAMLEALQDLEGVRQIMEVSGDRELLVVGLVTGREQAEHLRARIEDHAVGQPVRMDMLSFETSLPSRQTWVALARAELGLDDAKA